MVRSKLLVLALGASLNVGICVCVFAYVPSQDRPWEVTPGRASLQTLQKVGLACEQAYQLCIPEKCSMLNWLAWGGGIWKERTTTSEFHVKLAGLSEVETQKSSECYIRKSSLGKERYCRMGQ